MLSIKLGSTWLSTIGAYGPPTVSHKWPGGSDTASWEMDADLWHPYLRGSVPVTVYDGGFPIWTGTLNEPNRDGTYEAVGLADQATGVPCLSPGGSFTTVPDTAIDGAIARGEVTWASRTGSISAAAWAPAAAGDAMDLKQLLDGFCAENGIRWQINPLGQIEVKTDPTAVMWQVPHAVAGRGLTPSEDEFYTHLVGYYLASSTAYGVETVGSAEAAAAFRRRTGTVDLTKLGVITSARAISILTGMFLNAGARMGWAEGLTLSRGQIVTAGGRPAALEQVQAGQLVRLAGVLDTSRPSRVSTYVDVVIGSSRYVDGEDSISLTPLGYAPRTLSDVLKVAIES